MAAVGDNRAIIFLDIDGVLIGNISEKAEKRKRIMTLK